MSYYIPQLHAVVSQVSTLGLVSDYNCILLSPRTQMHMYIRTYTHTYIHVYTHTMMQACAHTLYQHVVELMYIAIQCTMVLYSRLEHIMLFFLPIILFRNSSYFNLLFSYYNPIILMNLFKKIESMHKINDVTYNFRFFSAGILLILLELSSSFELKLLQNY